MNAIVKKEVKELIEKCGLNCSVKKFKNKVCWINISHKQNLS